MVRGTETAVVLVAHIYWPSKTLILVSGSTLTSMSGPFDHGGSATSLVSSLVDRRAPHLERASNHGGKFSPLLGRIARVSETCANVPVAWLKREQLC